MVCWCGVLVCSVLVCRCVVLVCSVLLQNVGMLRCSRADSLFLTQTHGVPTIVRFHFNMGNGCWLQGTRVSVALIVFFKWYIRVWHLLNCGGREGEEDLLERNLVTINIIKKSLQLVDPCDRDNIYIIISACDKDDVM